MALALIFAGLWLFIAFTEPASVPLLVKVGAGGSMALGYLLTWYVPIAIRHRHIRNQNRLLDRCRALLIVGSRAHGAGDKACAEDALRRIRRLEGLWRLGNLRVFRIALAFWAIAWSTATCIAVRFGGLMMTHYGWTGELLAAEKMPAELGIAVALSIMAVLHALTSYFESWVNAWTIENCGDRLWEVMYGPRQIEMAAATETSEIPIFDGLSPQEVFGLGPGFTRRELDAARRRLARELHPDRWQQASPRERHLREEALKRVNAAFDVLRKQT